MRRILILIFGIILSFSVTYAGTTGKLAGKVVDANTGEPLVGANVIIEGTYFGASTDADGDYYIINVPVGTYTVVVTYVGYETIKHSGVRIILDQTTKVDFRMRESIAQGEVIEVTAESFKVQKDETSKKITIDKEELQAMPVKDFSDLVAAQAGIVQIESSVQQIAGFEDRGIEEIHVRGGRSGEIGYTIDGMYIVNPFYGHKYSWTQLNDFALEQVDIKTGVFDAEYGGAMSSMINMITRDGGEKFEANLRVQTSNPGRFFDPVNFFKKGSEAPINLFPEPDNKRDYRAISGGFGGPVPFTNKKLRYIVTGHYSRGAYHVYQFDNLTYDPSQPQDSKHNFHLNRLDTIPGWRAMGFIHGWDLYSKLTWNITNTMKLAASFWNLSTTFRTANFANSAYQFYEEGRNIVTQAADRQAIVFNHQISNKLFYNLRLSRFYQHMRIGVTDTGDEDGRYLEPDEYIRPQVDDDIENNQYWYEYYVKGHDRYYHKDFAETYEGLLNVLWQASKHHQIKTGASFRQHNIMLNEIQLPWLVSPYIERYRHHPQEAAAYIQDLIEYDYMTIHLGVRVDMLNAKYNYWKDPYAKPEDRVLVPTKWEYQVSPRLGFSHVITDNATFTFGYGKFYQTPAYRNKYINDKRDLTTPVPLVGNAGLQMESMTEYEFGLNMGVTDNIILQLIGWSKEYSNLTASERIPQFPYSFSTFLNQDYATARGVDVVLRRRTRRSSLMLQYTYSRATANRKDPWEGYRATQTQRTMPKREILMSYDRTHDISLSYFYIFPENSGPQILNMHPLARSRFNLMFLAISGWPYTPVVGNVAGETNSERGPWNYTVNFTYRRPFRFYGVDLILGVVVQNVFDWKNPIDVWPTTGKPDDPGPRYNMLIQRGFYSKTLFDLPYMYGRRRQVDLTLEFAF